MLVVVMEDVLLVMDRVRCVALDVMDMDKLVVAVGAVVFAVLVMEQVALLLWVSGRPA